MVMLQNLRAFPLHYLVACLVNGLAVVGVPPLGLRMRLNDSWLFVAMALLMAGWAICIGLLETTLLNHTGIQLRWLGFVRVLAGFLAGGLVCYIGYLLAFSTLGHVFSGLTPSRTASILLSVFGAIGLGCWGVGLILPLEAVRPYIR
jgi:hypothetical protein